MDWVSWTSDPQAWIALLTLTVLEIVLGIDNIVFIAILSGKLPVEDRPRARRLGLLLAMGMRVALLFSLSWLMTLTDPLFALFGHTFSGKDLILLIGGLFLLVKATLEIHERLEGSEERPRSRASVTLTGVVVQIMLLDIVFSLDSVITAVGLAAGYLPVMVLAVLIAVLVMMVFVNPISDFVERRPTVRMLALSFLLLIGVTLVSEGVGFHFPKGYVYFAMAFSAFVEALNLKIRKPPRRAPVDLRDLPLPGGGGE